MRRLQNGMRHAFVHTLTLGERLHAPSIRSPAPRAHAQVRRSTSQAVDDHVAADEAQGASFPTGAAPPAPAVELGLSVAFLVAEGDSNRERKPTTFTCAF